MRRTKCAGCGELFKSGETQYHSSIFGAHPFHLLCERCHKAEEFDIELEGTNAIPLLKELYYENCPNPS